MRERNLSEIEKEVRIGASDTWTASQYGENEGGGRIDLVVEEPAQV